MTVISGAKLDRISASAYLDSWSIDVPGYGCEEEEAAHSLEMAVVVRNPQEYPEVLSLLEIIV